MTTFSSWLAFATIVLCSASVGAQSISIRSDENNATFSGSFDFVSAEEIASDYDDDGFSFGNSVLVDGAVKFSLFTTTGSDILLFDLEIVDTLGMNVPGGWYNNEQSLGKDVQPPLPIFVPVFPVLGVDSWVTTPGDTAAAGANTLNGDRGQRLVTHYDSTDEGPQTDFQFAQFTLLPDADGNASAMLRGTLQTHPLGNPTPFFDTFEINFSLVPEPGSGVLLLTSLLGLSFLRRRKRRES